MRNSDSSGGSKITPRDARILSNQLRNRRREDTIDHFINALDKAEQHLGAIPPAKHYSVLDAHVRAEMSGKEVDQSWLARQKKNLRAYVARYRFED